MYENKNNDKFTENEIETNRDWTVSGNGII